MLSEAWQQVRSKLEEEKRLPAGGCILSVCFTGSRVYNLHSDTSDVDLVIVWAAKTRDLLAIDPPEPLGLPGYSGSIKNPESERPDYTVHEAKKFCRLLLQSDPRCIESLFIDSEKAEILCSEDFNLLKSMRSMFLTKELVSKYLSHAETEVRRCRKYDAGDRRTSKKVYVAARLLLFASTILNHEPLSIWMPEDFPPRKTLMDYKNGIIPGRTLDELQSQIDSLRVRLETSDLPLDASLASKPLESWLFQIRKSLLV